MVGGVQGFRCSMEKCCSFPRSDPAFPLWIPLRPWWDCRVSGAVGTRLISFLSLQYIGSLDVPRPNSRVEIVTAMRRIRVSVARALLPPRGARGSPPPARAALSCINPVLQRTPNSVFFTAPLSADISVSPGHGACRLCVAQPCLQRGCPRGTRASCVLWLQPEQ